MPQTSRTVLCQEWPIAGPVKKQAYLDLDMEAEGLHRSSWGKDFVFTDGYTVDQIINLLSLSVKHEFRREWGIGLSAIAKPGAHA